MPSGSQIRAARGLLGISAAELAERAGVTWKTIQRFETVEGIPANRSGTLDKVRAALEREGIEFFGDPETSPGVRLRR
jgi:transcriptional regulator with XRE-family HTH domain